MVFPVAFKTKGSFDFGSYGERDGADVGVGVLRRDCGADISFCGIDDGVLSRD
jgi:hypothetical protein